MTKRNLQSPKFKKIVEIASNLFSRYGIKRVSIEEICKTANVSKMTFYKYFKNKINLVKYLWAKMFDDSLAKLDEIEAMDIPFPEKIKLLLKLKEEYTSKLSRESVSDFLNVVPELQEFYNGLFQKSMNRFMKFIKNAQKKGEVRPEMHPEFFMAAIQKLTELAYNENLTKLYPDYTDFVLEVNNFIYYGILPRPD